MDATLDHTVGFRYRPHGQHLSVGRPGIVYAYRSNRDEAYPVWAESSIVLDNKYSSLESISQETWNKEIGWGLESWALHERHPLAPLPGWSHRTAMIRQRHNRLIREIELLGPSGVNWFISNHKSIYNHPYRNLVKGYMGVTPVQCGGGGGQIIYR